MKLLFTLCFSMFFVGGVMSQKYDARLLQRFTEIQLSNLQNENPQELDLLNYALDNAIYFADVPEGKNIELTEISLPNGEPTFINLGLNIEDQNQYFLVREKNKMLVVKSSLVLSHEMNKK